MSAFDDDFSDLTGPLVLDGSECKMSLVEIQNELTALTELAHRGYDIDERRFDYLLKAQDENPEYMEFVAEEKEHWRESVAEFAQECLERTRTFIPVDIFQTSYDDLIRLGLSPELSRRIQQRQCLWLTRMSKKEIAKLHDYDIIGRYNSLQQQLDIIETAAVYAALPEVFGNDPLGKKGDWRNAVEDYLRQMLLENDEDKLPSHRIRNPAYEGLQFGPIEDTQSVRHSDVVSSADSFLPRTSFTETCRQHSLVNKMKSANSVSARRDKEDSDDDYGNGVNQWLDEPDEVFGTEDGNIGNRGHVGVNAEDHHKDV
jgi:hypothetical protein